MGVRMKVLDIFSWVSAKEIGLEQLEQIFIDYNCGICQKEYTILLELPYNVTLLFMGSVPVSEFFIHKRRIPRQRICKTGSHVITL